jgi:hypothetical protein
MEERLETTTLVQSPAPPPPQALSGAQPYEPPDVIAYGSLEELTLGGGGNTDDTNVLHPHFHNS